MLLVLLAGIAMAGVAPAATTGTADVPERPSPLEWQKLPPLPPAPGHRVQPGVAGAFVGVASNALLVAGGANFPIPVSEGGQKTFHRDVYILEKIGGGDVRWSVNVAFKLPRPCGYGGSISIAAGLVCIGGSDVARCTNEVFLLQWNPGKRTLSVEPWPALPEPAVDITATLAGQRIFIAGGKAALSGDNNHSTQNFWMLDLSHRHQPDDFHWRRLPAWPGAPRSKAILVAQASHGTDQVFLFSGRNEQPGKPTIFLSDAYVYDVARNQWQPLRPVASGMGDGGKGRSVMVGTGVALPSGEIAIFSGSDGGLYQASNEINQRITAAETALKTVMDAPRRNQLVQELTAHMAARQKFIEEFPGFSKDVLLYQPTGDRWRKLGEFSGLPPVTTTAATWDGGIVIPTGEVIPSIRSDTVWKAIIRP